MPSSLVLPAKICSIGMMALGIGCLWIGYTFWDILHSRYSVEFAHAGDECDETDPKGIYLEAWDGSVLECTSTQFGGLGPGTITLPGFESDQNDEVNALVTRLSSDGLTKSDQRRIQKRVKEIGARVPDTRTERVWAPRLLWSGAGIGAAGTLGLVGVLRLERERLRPEPEAGP